MKKLINWFIGLKSDMKIAYNMFKQLRKSLPKMKAEQNIIKEVCNCANITTSEMFANLSTRKLKYAIPRQVAAVLVFYCFDEYSQTYVEKLFGKKHPYIPHCLKTVNDYLYTDKKFRKQYAPAFKVAFKFNYQITKYLHIENIV